MVKDSKLWRLAALVFLPALGGLSGCGFFPPLSQCTTNCTASTDFMYVANSSNTTASPASVAGFSLTTTTTAATATTPATSTLALAVTPGSAYALGFVPTAMAMNPANTFLYVASLDTGGIYLYSVGSTGTLTLQNNSQPVASGLIASAIKVDTTGKFLIVANASLSTTKTVMTVYTIATATGLLSSPASLTIPVVGASSHLAIAANDVNVFLTIGTGGTASMTFNSLTGVLTYQGILAPKSAQGAAVGVTANPTNTYVFVTETAISAVRVLSIGTNGKLTEVAGSPFSTGTGPSGVVVDAKGSYVYVTNSTDNTVSGFVLAANGTLTQIAGSPFSTGTTPVDIAEDSSGLYVGVVCSGGGQDLEVYSFDATTLGALDAAANATTGTDPTLPIAIVATL
jgi:6-phosphogluconolactonase